MVEDLSGTKKPSLQSIYSLGKKVKLLACSSELPGSLLHMIFFIDGAGTLIFRLRSHELHLNCYVPPQLIDWGVVKSVGPLLLGGVA